MPPPTLPTSCPLCSGHLEHGTASIHGTLAGFFFLGMSYQHCFFKTPTTPEQIALASRHQRRAFRCQSCHALTLYGPETSL